MVCPVPDIRRHDQLALIICRMKLLRRSINAGAVRTKRKTA
jgi:hypothetical protein